MSRRFRGPVERLYARVLESELEMTPSHIAVIQDGNRRYAAERGVDKTTGHKQGAQTTEKLLKWCGDLDIQEVTLYAFSTENFERPPDEREALFDLITEKLRDFADADDVHEREVRIRAIGETDELPERVRDAIEYAESRTESYDRLYLNIALAYGGRAELLGATRDIARAVQRGEIDPAEITPETVEQALPDGPSRSVDLIIRSGGDERTSNFLPWQANGNEAAVYFTAPYWPEFRRIDFLRALRTYNYREASWRQTRVRRARAFAGVLRETITGGWKGVVSGDEDGESAEQTVESPG
ncbi:di-trans,poly-cis-decaprenylcistransferase [Halovenus sp. WSH3]|uniref:Tritrans,polycis-undecaprenyl-diphosphate synthase (geranylgeranyl-diphosphate specific) n=1 Tax=Halovenus carboxidivorans TaxID=2692199 RepID=A0A6B0T5N8_9EURY|nr:polyprenyl diphosphate synthase [Halovenus carboxidivorans]MXR50873.1 di-trans,poly-cis-decaprenylcistransferase [Halovenus carboxidivorans]